MEVCYSSCCIRTVGRPAPEILLLQYVVVYVWLFFRLAALKCSRVSRLVSPMYVLVLVCIAGYVRREEIIRNRNTPKTPRLIFLVLG